MGTHPIFESDFDCLTDCIKMNAKTSFAQKIKEKMKKDMPGKASALNAISEDDRGRKVWDRGEYSKMAEDRLKKDIEKATKYGPDANLEKRDLPSSMRDPVQARVKRVDLDSGVGKTKAIHYENGNNGKGSGGYYCSVCDVNVKDSRAYLNHLNGRRQQRNMGFNPYKLPESSVVGVQQRFQEKIKKGVQKSKEAQNRRRDGKLGRSAVRGRDGIRFLWVKKEVLNQHLNEHKVKKTLLIPFSGCNIFSSKRFCHFFFIAYS